jgi:hypothetical protein
MDPYVHHGTPEGVLSELMNAFVRSPRQPTMQQMERMYDLLQRASGGILLKAGAKTPFKARAFEELVASARNLANAVFRVPPGGRRLRDR